MAIRSNVNIGMVYVDPLSLTAGIKVLSGHPVQTYNRDTQEYEPDRSLVPLIILPWVSAADPEGLQGGSQTLTGVEWYDGSPKADKSNLIANDDSYEVSANNSVTGFPQYALKVKKNVDPDKPKEIFCIAIFNDRRAAAEIKIERSVKLYTTLYDSRSYSLKIVDQPKNWTVDPIRITPDADGRWLHTITAQLFSGKDAVPDANAAYWWEVNDKGSWREITEDDLAIWISGRDSDGNWGKALTFDARLVGNVSFRCRGAYYTDTRPSTPVSEELQAITSVCVKMPESMDVVIYQTKGGRQTSKMDTVSAYSANVFDNRQQLPEDRYDLVQIWWKVKSSKPGSSEISLGTGRNISFIPKDIGLSAQYPYDVYADVRLYSHHAVWKDSVYVAEGTKVLIEPIYK